jgi:hypothetical protein
MLGLSNGGLKALDITQTVDFNTTDASVGGSAVCQLWLKYNTNLTAAQWDDASGNGRHAAQSTSGNRATVDDNGLLFDPSTNNHYDFTAIVVAESEAFFVFMVIDLDAASNESLLGESASVFLTINDNNTIKFKTAAGTDNVNVEGTPFATGEKFILGIQRDEGPEGRIHIYKNGVKLHITNAALGQQQNIGAISFDTLGTRHGDQFFGGHMYEVLVYDTANLSIGETKGIFNYLKTTHSIT